VSDVISTDIFLPIFFTYLQKYFDSETIFFLEASVKYYMPVGTHIYGIRTVAENGNWNFRSHVLSLLAAKVPWVELSFLELSLPGTFVPWNFHPLELSLPRAKIT